MALANETSQYLSILRPGEDRARLVKRIHYVSFVGMLRADFFEGLCVGHAPKKCRICGRWFLTTNARHTKYCGGFAPGDKLGRTCRQIGNLRGREQRELAPDHPLKKIYSRRMNTIDKKLERGTLDEETAAVMKRLAKSKMQLAISDVAYAQGGYAAEMEQAALLAEAQRGRSKTISAAERGGADMKDKRDELIPEQLSGYTWELSGYAPKVPFSNSDSLTMREVRNAFQLTPEPPEMELNDYIREAVRKRDLSYFSFFLHHFENRLNGVIYRFLTRNGIDRYGPAWFLDYKLEVLQMLLYCLPRFDPEQETEFLKYAKHYVRDGPLFCRMMVEAGSFASLAEYRHVRQIGAIYNNSAKTAQKSFPSLPSKADTRMKAYLRMNC